MTLDQLMAFAVSDDHDRQARVWEILAHSINKSPAFIRARLTESTVRASDPRLAKRGAGRLSPALARRARRRLP